MPPGRRGSRSCGRTRKALVSRKVLESWVRSGFLVRDPGQVLAGRPGRCPRSARRPGRPPAAGPRSPRPVRSQWSGRAGSRSRSFRLTGQARIHVLLQPLHPPRCSIRSLLERGGVMVGGVSRCLPGRSRLWVRPPPLAGKWARHPAGGKWARHPAGWLCRRRRVLRRSTGCLFSRPWSRTGSVGGDRRLAGPVGSPSRVMAGFRPPTRAGAPPRLSMRRHRAALLRPGSRSGYRRRISFLGPSTRRPGGLRRRRPGRRLPRGTASPVSSAASGRAVPRQARARLTTQRIKVRNER
jgi:hypothetical protein